MLQQPKVTAVVVVVIGSRLLLCHDLLIGTFCLLQLSAARQCPCQRPCGKEVVGLFVVELVEQLQRPVIVFRIDHAHSLVQHVAALFRMLLHQLVV